MVHFLLLIAAPWQRQEAARPTPPPECVSGVKPLHFPLPPGEFLQHKVRMLVGFCLLWILYYHHLLGIYLPRTRLLYIWEIPYRNVTCAIHNKRATCTLPCTVTESFYPVCVTSPKQPGQFGHSNAHGSAQIECGTHPSGLALQRWGVVFYYQQCCLLLPGLELLLLDQSLPRDLR